MVKAPSVRWSRPPRCARSTPSSRLRAGVLPSGTPFASAAPPSTCPRRSTRKRYNLRGGGVPLHTRCTFAPSSRSCRATLRTWAQPTGTDWSQRLWLGCAAQPRRSFHLHLLPGPSAHAASSPSLVCSSYARRRGWNGSKRICHMCMRCFCGKLNGGHSEQAERGTNDFLG